MKMDQLRETALAYYANLPQSQKKLASEFFKSLDRNGDGKIDVQEYITVLRELGVSWINNAAFFKELDMDGNGTLDFEEVVTLFYIIESRRFIRCDGCGAFLSGVYFTCLTCFNSGPRECNSFDLCCSCYRNRNFKHHADSIFVDNYIMLRSKWNQTVSKSQTFASQAQQTPRESSAKKPIEYVAATSNAVTSIFRLADLLSNLF